MCRKRWVSLLFVIILSAASTFCWGAEESFTFGRFGEVTLVQKHWMPQFKQVFSRLVATQNINSQMPPVGELKDLPLIEVPAHNAGTDLLAVHITGDGGYGVTDRGLSTTLAEHGIPVVCLNSLHYFWKPRTPESASKDLERILRYYLAAWKKQKVILIGYSIGADVLPFMVNRLSEEMRATIQLVVFLGLGKTAEFEFHVTNWFGDSAKNALPVLPEVKRLTGMKMLCFYGEDDVDTLCKSLDPALVKPIVLKGGHRIGRNFAGIADVIIKEVEKK